MAYPTPPSTASKRKRFTEPSNYLPYYEDIYGKRNEDEAFDRFPDDCEEESESEDDEIKNTRNDKGNGFFRKFAQPKRKISFPEQGFGDFGEVNQREGRNVFSFINMRDLTSTPNNSNAVPASNSKQSVALEQANRPKKLTPKKYGFFASPSAPMPPPPPPPVSNYAGEAMDDLWGMTTLNDLDDGFPTLEENDDNSGANPALEMKDAGGDSYFMNGVREYAKKQGDEIPVDVQKNSLQLPATNAPRASDADVEDNVSEVGDAKGAIQGPIPRGNIPGGVVKAVKTQKATGPTRYSTRQRQQFIDEVGKKRTTRSMTRPLHGKNKAEQIKANNRKKMTARAATLLNKAKTKDEDAQLEHSGRRQAASGRQMRVRNWKGDLLKLGKGQGFVVVGADEVDAEEYVRYE